MDAAQLRPWRDLPYCRTTQGGAIKLYKSLVCPLDGYELLLFSLSGADGKTYPLCPFCYNSPPFEGVAKVGTSSCGAVNWGGGGRSLTGAGLVGCGEHAGQCSLRLPRGRGATQARIEGGGWSEDGVARLAPGDSLHLTHNFTSGLSCQ